MIYFGRQERPTANSHLPTHMNDKTFVERIADIIQINANAKQVYGEPVERDGATIIPVARVQWGFGGGGLGQGPSERGGGGGGVRATPAGYIEMRDGESHFRPIHDDNVKLIAIGAGAVLVGLLLARLL